MHCIILNDQVHPYHYTTNDEELNLLFELFASLQYHVFPPLYLFFTNPKNGLILSPSSHLFVQIVCTKVHLLQLILLGMSSTY
jgi:hypothetical protein